MRTIYCDGFRLRDLEDVKTLEGLQKWVDTVVDLVPPEYRKMANVEVYLDEGISTELTYERPETEEDRRYDAHRLAAEEEDRRFREHQQFLRLKAKFEPEP